MDVKGKKDFRRKKTFEAKWFCHRFQDKGEEKKSVWNVIHEIVALHNTHLILGNIIRLS